MHCEDGLIVLDESGAFLWANPAASELLGYPRYDFTGGSLGPHGPIAEALAELRSNGEESAEGEARLPAKDNSRIAVRWSLWKLPRTTGCVGQYLLFITRAKAAASATAGYRDVFENAIEGIFRTTVAGRFLEANPALADMFGFQNSAEFMKAVELHADAKQAQEFVSRMLTLGFVSGFEAQLNHKNGDPLWLAIFARTVRSEHGDPLYFEGSVINITDHKQTESELRMSEERFRLLAETTRVVPYEFDSRLRMFTYVGPQAEMLFNLELRRGLTLRRWSTMVNPEDVEEATRFAKEPALTEARDFQTEFRMRASGNREIWVKQIVHRAPVNEKNGRIRGFFFEITEAKKIELEREYSRTQLRELAAQTQTVREEERMVIAREIHDELGQALTMLKIELSWMTRRLLGLTPEKSTKPLVEKIGSMEQLIHWTLQSMRRILSSLRPPLLDESGLKDAIEFHLQDFSKRLAIRFDWEADEKIDELPVHAATAVFRIFQEILTNVARHANASRVKVSFRQDRLQTTLEVRDNGCGITQDKIARSRSFGLLGMQERAWAIGGELEVQGSPRSGTCVVLKIPREAVAIKPAEFPSVPGSGSGIRPVRAPSSGARSPSKTQKIPT